MNTRMLVFIVWNSITAITSAWAGGSCEAIIGSWQGRYKINPSYFGFSVGYCDYEASMNIYKNSAGDYEADISNRLVDGEGKAEKSCDANFSAKAQLVCDGEGVQFISNDDQKPSLNIQSTWKSLNELVSQGDFKHKSGGHTLNVSYTFNISRPLCLGAGYHELINSYQLSELLETNNGCRVRL